MFSFSPKFTLVSRRLSSTLNVGVIGVGRMGQLHLRSLSKTDGVKVVCLADTDRSLASKLAETHRVPKYTTSAEDLINNPEINAVYITSPSAFHAEHILACVKANKHIFCEKPISTDLKRSMEMVRMVKASGIKMMVGFQRRFDNHFKSLFTAIANKSIGDPVHAMILSRDPSPPSFNYVRSSGGLFRDMALHDFDVANWLMNAASIKDSGGKLTNHITRVYATGALFHDKSISILDIVSEQIDTATITLSFSSGATAVISVCRKSGSGYDQRVDVLGTTGSASIGNSSSSSLSLLLSQASGQGVMTSSKPIETFLDRYQQAYEAETAEFISCIKSNKHPGCDVSDGLMALQVAHLAGVSLRDKRMVDVNELLNI